MLWLMIREVSVNGHLILFLWACGSTEWHGGSMGWRRSVHLTVAKKQRGRKGGWDTNVPFKGARTDLISSH